MIQPQNQEQDIPVVRGLMGPERTLSWSQIHLVLNNPRQYYKKYILGEKQFETKETIAGKDLHEKIENDEDLGLDTELEKVDKKEDWIECPFDHENGEVKLVGQVDGITASENRITFAERKSGKNPWFQEKVDTFGQLKIYAYILKKKTGILPESAVLEWIQTEEVDGQIVPTGKVFTFTKIFTEKDISDAHDLIREAIRKIEYMYHNFDKHSDLILQYISFKSKIELYTEKLDAIRLQIQNELQKENLDKMITPFATISMTEKKSYNLSSQQKAELDSLKKEFQKNIEPEISSYMTIRIT